MESIIDMITLSVENFSCLRSAYFQLAPVTILIGPQGSGKSVTTKLHYFFCDILQRQYTFAENGSDLSEFKKDISRQFRAWFPPAAWGKEKFSINFNAGLFTVRILRKISRGQLADDVSINMSGFFESQYRELCVAYNEYRVSSADSDSQAFRRSMEGAFKIRDNYERRMAKELGSSYVNSQTFIPAGRAFFTSIGRLVAAIEQGSSLDPVTIRFAKLFAALRDRSRHRFVRSSIANESYSKNRQFVMKQLFGGEIKFENELEYVEANDGRKVPFSALSSGQQELLPMWILVDYFASLDGARANGNEVFYIEEPEAHLFPAAQSLLMDFFISTLVSKQERRSLVLTTHSPYILAKLNNYLKAGSLGRSRRNVENVARIVPRECWLTPERVKAYAIEDGVLRELIDSSGLIDARYIDEVSEQVATTFEALLDIEFPETSG